MTRCALVLVLALPCLAAKPPSTRVKNFLGDKAVDVLSAADRVEVYRIQGFRPDPQKKPDDKAEKIGGYMVLAKGKEQGKEFAGRLREVLFNDKTYLFDVAKLCIFDPGVAFRMRKGEVTVEVLLCFSCDEVLVLTSEGGKVARRSHEDVDPMRAVLVKLAKEALPDDKDIQALKEKGR
jgi:hypothetical protein